MSTLKEMAATLNLSVMAVSKALRDAPDISTSTKARVQAEARRRNYIPNRAAQNLRLRRSGLVGVVVPQINHTYYSHLVWGVERQAEAVGLQVLLGSSLDRAENEMREVQKLIARQVEALLLVPAVRWQHRLATLEMVRASGIPTVLLDAYPAGAERFPGVSWVVCDDARGGQIATEHLLELGHKQILFLAGPNGSSSSAGRFSGYQRALAAAEALAQQGLRVPEDVSIVGFGDGLMATHYRVPLTTVRVPQAEIGEKG